MGRDHRAAGTDFETDSRTVPFVTFSPDGRMALIADSGNTRLLDVANGQQIRSFPALPKFYDGDTQSVTTAAFSPDGRYVAAASFDSEVRLWDVGSGQQLRLLEGHTGGVKSVAFSPDGRYVIAASDDGTSRTWDAATGGELAALLSFDENGWAVTDTSGRYDTSDPGNESDRSPPISWVVGDQPNRHFHLRFSCVIIMSRGCCHAYWQVISFRNCLRSRI